MTSFIKRLPSPFKLAITAATLLLILIASPAQGETVTADRAQRVVQAWLDNNNECMRTNQGDILHEVIPYYSENNTLIFYLATIRPGGYVILSADDLLEPIIAFSPSGVFDDSPESTLYAVVVYDTKGRKAMAENLQHLAFSPSAPGGLDEKRLPEFARKSRGKWRQLSDQDDSIGMFKSNGPGKDPFNQGPPPDMAGLSSISDERVAPLLSSEWSQGTAQGQYCYNYYTPNHYVCGCVATATAQVMRCHEYPEDGIGLVSRSCSVNGSWSQFTTRGGDGAGGAYNWSLMNLDPGSSSYNAAEWEQIGALCYDAGVGVEMMWSSSGSGAYTSNVSSALQDIFGFSSGYYMYWPETVAVGGSVAVINTNLQAGFPLVLGIAGSGVGGHAVVADGWGYSSGTMYHHINMGWGGSYDAWYNLPNIQPTPSYPWNMISTLNFNLFPEDTGEIIAGRVRKTGGAPVSGALVSAVPQGGGGPYTALTNAKGHYGIIVPSSTTYNLTATHDDYPDATLNSIAATQSGDGSAGHGNYYGADISMSAWPVQSLKATALQDSVVLRWSDPQSSGLPNSTVYIRRDTTAYPTTSSEGTLAYTGTAVTFEDTSLTEDQDYYYTIWADDGSSYADFPTGSNVNAGGAPDPGKFKIFWRNTSTLNLAFWILNDSGTIKSANPIIDIALPLAWEVGGTGDIDRDGYDDIILHHVTTGQVAFWLLDADGTCKDYGFVYESVLGAKWMLCAVNDINDDGTVDLLWHHQTTKLVAYWLLDTDGSIASAGFVDDDPLDTSWEVKGLEDISGDGIADILWYHQGIGKAAYWILQGDCTLGSFGIVYDTALDSTWEVIGFKDINDDETADILWHHQGSGLVAYWLLKTDGTLDTYGLIYDDPLDSSWELKGVKDINEDDIPDMLWYHSSGYVAYWMLNDSCGLESFGLVYGSSLPSVWNLDGVGR